MRPFKTLELLQLSQDRLVVNPDDPDALSVLSAVVLYARHREIALEPAMQDRVLRLRNNTGGNDETRSTTA